MKLLNLVTGGWRGPVMIFTDNLMNNKNYKTVVYQLKKPVFKGDFEDLEIDKVLSIIDDLDMVCTTPLLEVTCEDERNSKWEHDILKSFFKGDEGVVVY